ncbi:E3 ubiquitin-protein ligase SIRP1-like [Phragmites australis]|uniref:E3 ubiquitin-protein ligase SIRP1-like n=1 Tax=Phragmites australis TaxID=29695 RepID=UPI002D77C890|nr:E3 ubiquitin-protein ligase SIRP1-like [Phragmites australis]XP_062212809.1 E3 ubiquitin-protein ligase SIRP1-like [Phragmites australis]XP_062212810.1 E3 ubiquitin-protein ligase SIRP1-like [Phragmites australis]
MDEVQGVRYWCHSCEEVIDFPMPEMKCPNCEEGFVEEMDSEGFEPAMNSRSDRLSLLAPLLLGMLGGSSRRSRLRRVIMDEDDDDDDSDHEREREDSSRRRRRRGTSVFDRLLQTLRDDIRGLDDIDSDTERDMEGQRRESERERQREWERQLESRRDRERERERQRDGGRERTESLILINSNNEAIILQGTFGPDDNQEDPSITSSGVSLGDYFLGSGLDLLLQRLAESDLNRSGTPPAKKEAVAALPTVNIQEVLGCSVCLEDFVMGKEAKEMPCQHKFHSHCILPWLELHSSCPVCRYQLPTEESKNPCESARTAGFVNSDGDSAAASSSDT